MHIKPLVKRFCSRDGLAEINTETVAVVKSSKERVEDLSWSSKVILCVLKTGFNRVEKFLSFLGSKGCAVDFGVEDLCGRKGAEMLDALVLCVGARDDDSGDFGFSADLRVRQAAGAPLVSGPGPGLGAWFRGGEGVLHSMTRGASWVRSGPWPSCEM